MFICIYTHTYTYKYVCMYIYTPIHIYVYYLVESLSIVRSPCKRVCCYSSWHLDEHLATCKDIWQFRRIFGNSGIHVTHVKSYLCDSLTRVKSLIYMCYTAHLNAWRDWCAWRDVGMCVMWLVDFCVWVVPLSWKRGQKNYGWYDGLMCDMAQT